MDQRGLASMLFRFFDKKSKSSGLDYILKGIKYLLCAVDLFSTYAWIVSLKDKKRVTAVNAFQCIFDNSKKKNKQNMG